MANIRHSLDTNENIVTQKFLTKKLQMKLNANHTIHFFLQKIFAGKEMI